MKYLIVLCAIVIIIAVLFPLNKKKELIDILAVDGFAGFEDANLTIHYYQQYGKTWDIELKSIVDGSIVTAKDKSFKVAIERIRKQREALDTVVQ